MDRPPGDKTQDAKSRSELINDPRGQLREVQEKARKAYREIRRRQQTLGLRTHCFCAETRLPVRFQSMDPQR
ncbi:hypothetical protein A1D31_32415 [Bradyrhizobium liaoningense]|nr:hypothetical protein A1D31_32415 [Bradyrhizobium liaoningense]